ncbi:MAG: nucleoside phosphorylase [Proteobacteria bacterium]|nr:nucleoside phosphorylase [Pseudomonadota bacterium]MBU1742169.1 nucleoside phosphorylase [Pseudomonadota bacterium]
MRYFSRPEEQCLIEPRRGRNEPAIGPVALLILTEPDLALFRTLADIIDAPADNRGFYRLHRKKLDHLTLSVAGPALGAPQAVLILEKLIALGGRTFFTFGWCGSLQPELTIGQIIIPRRAVSEEGASRHYPLEGEEGAASPGLVAALEKSLARAGVPYAAGTIWTTDAPYRETVKKVTRFQQKGVLAVDMEASALFAVAAFRRVELAAMMVVSDELHALEWKHGFRAPHFAQARDQALRLLLEMTSGSPT